MTGEQMQQTMAHAVEETKEFTIQHKVEIGMGLFMGLVLIICAIIRAKGKS